MTSKHTLKTPLALNNNKALSFSILYSLFSIFAHSLLTTQARAQDERSLRPIAKGETILISGGPALRRWENLRVQADRHDRWWGNFIRPARVRIQDLQKARGENTPITWMVYRDGYSKRGSEDGRNLLDLVRSVQRKYGVRLRWFNSGQELIAYLNSGNNRRSNPIVHLEYFGHSNKHCFLFDYSSHVMGASKAWLHENELKQIGRRALHRKAYVKSWGCHTGESMSAAWRKATGSKMIGAVGKTDYSGGYRVVLSPGGRWKS